MALGRVGRRIAKLLRYTGKSFSETATKTKQTMKTKPLTLQPTNKIGKQNKTSLKGTLLDKLKAQAPNFDFGHGI